MMTGTRHTLIEKERYRLRGDAYPDHPGAECLQQHSYYTHVFNNNYLS